MFENHSPQSKVPTLVVNQILNRKQFPSQCAMQTQREKKWNITVSDIYNKQPPVCTEHTHNILNTQAAARLLLRRWVSNGKKNYRQTTKRKKMCICQQKCLFLLQSTVRSLPIPRGGNNGYFRQRLCVLCPAIPIPQRRRGGKWLDWRVEVGCLWLKLVKAVSHYSNRRTRPWRPLCCGLALYKVPTHRRHIYSCPTTIGRRSSCPRYGDLFLC